MGRKTLSRQKQKIDAVYKTAGHKSLKAKGSAKPVNFKSFKMRERVEESNKRLSEIQELVSMAKKPKTKDNVVTSQAREKDDTEMEDGEERQAETSVEDITNLQNSLQIHN